MTDHVAFKAIADPAKATMEITMVRNGTPVASVEIDTKDASAIAGVVLSAAKSAYDEEQWKTPPLSRTLAAQLRRLALIEAYVRALEATDFAARLENLERANNR